MNSREEHVDGAGRRAAGPRSAYARPQRGDRPDRSSTRRALSGFDRHPPHAVRRTGEASWAADWMTDTGSRWVIGERRIGKCREQRGYLFRGAAGRFQDPSASGRAGTSTTWSTFFNVRRSARVGPDGGRNRATAETPCEPFRGCTTRKSRSSSSISSSIAVGLLVVHGAEQAAPCASAARRSRDDDTA